MEEYYKRLKDNVTLMRRWQKKFFAAKTKAQRKEALIASKKYEAIVDMMIETEQLF